MWKKCLILRQRHGYCRPLVESGIAWSIAQRSCRWPWATFKFIYIISPTANLFKCNFSYNNCAAFDYCLWCRSVCTVKFSNQGRPPSGARILTRNFFHCLNYCASLLYYWFSLHQLQNQKSCAVREATIRKTAFENVCITWNKIGRHSRSS